MNSILDYEKNQIYDSKAALKNFPELRGKRKLNKNLRLKENRFWRDTYTHTGNQNEKNNK